MSPSSTQASRLEAGAQAQAIGLSTPHLGALFPSSAQAQAIGSLYDASPGLRGNVGFSAGIATFLY